MDGEAKLDALSVTCNHCGAPLEVPAATQFVTCQYCGARLEIHRSGGAVHTQVLEAIDQRTQRIAQDVDTIKLQNELERIDREWAAERERFMVRGRNGTMGLPGDGGGVGLIASILIGVIAVAFILFWIGTAFSMGAPIVFLIFGVGVLVVVILGIVIAANKSGPYRQAQIRYQDRRQAALDNLQEREQP